MEPYKPVACDFVDQIEIAALKNKAGTIRYLDQGKEVTIEDGVVSWRTENKIEYLLTTNGRQIRLDHILWLIDQPGPAADHRTC